MQQSFVSARPESIHCRGEIVVLFSFRNICFISMHCLSLETAGSMLSAVHTMAYMGAEEEGRCPRSQQVRGQKLPHQRYFMTSEHWGILIHMKLKLHLFRQLYAVL